ncbi:UNVERIFIED_CONTAM: hypothetical protein GTU68_067211 [Idotea baltica]|nr:hypothetical protein [Idotea baltica]
MTERVIFLMMHVKKYPKDTKAGRYLTKLLDQRRKMMNYLMKTDYHRYQWICTDYGIPQVHPLNAHHLKK